MLDVDPINLMREVDQAESWRDQHMPQTDNLIQQYTSEAYREGSAGDWSENHPFEYIRLTTGRIIFNNPRVRVKTARSRAHRNVALAIQHGLNRWARATKLRRLLKRTYVDMCFGFSPLMSTVQPHPWQDPRPQKGTHWPAAYKQEMRRFFFDPLAMWFGQARYTGHKWVRDLEDLKAEAKRNPKAGWNAGALEQLSADAGVEELEERREGSRMNMRRKEIVGYDLWVPEKDMRPRSRGFNGSIFTIAATGATSEHGAKEAVYLRQPRPFFGPRWGPYTMFGGYPVPMDAYPLAPFVATYLQQRDLNQIVAAAVNAMKKYKRVVFVEASNPDLVKKAKDSPDSFVVPVKGFDKDKIVSQEFGGLTEQHVRQMAQAMDRLDRNTGVNQPERGNITGATATEIAKADAASSESIAFVKQEFTDGVIQVLETIGWYLWHDPRIAFPLGEDAQDQMGMGEPWFIGGNDGPDRYEDLELDIEPYSMEMTNGALARAQYAEMVELVMNAGTIIPQTPFYDWKRIFEKGGEVQNDATFAEFFRADVAEALAGQVLASEQGFEASGVPAGRMERLSRRGFVPAPNHSGGSTRNRMGSVRGAA